MPHLPVCDAANERRTENAPAGRRARLLPLSLLLLHAACSDPSAVDDRPRAAPPSPAVPAGAVARMSDAFVESIGVNIHLSYLSRVYGTRYGDIIRPKLRQLGVRHLRDGGFVSLSAGWNQLVYGRYRQIAHETGARFTIIMRPAERANGVLDYASAAHVGTLIDYIGAQNIEAFEGLNEHDHFGGGAAWADEVRKFQRALWTAVREKDAYSGYAVLGPSFSRSTHAQAVGDLSAFMDFGVTHPYPGGREPLASLASSVSALRVTNGSLPAVATETGYHNGFLYDGGHPAVSERAMGRYIPRLFLEYFGAGVPRTFAYELIDQGASPSDIEQNYGLLRNDGSEKPAFTALRNLIALLSDPGPGFTPERLEYTIEGDTSKVRRALLQKRDGRFFLALWQAVPSFDIRTMRDTQPGEVILTIRLARAASVVRLHAPLESVTPLEQLEDVTVIRVPVPDYPVVVEIQR
jgi:hypothetical protein